MRFFEVPSFELINLLSELCAPFTRQLGKDLFQCAIFGDFIYNIFNNTPYESRIVMCEAQLARSINYIRPNIVIY